MHKVCAIVTQNVHRAITCLDYELLSEVVEVLSDRLLK